MNRTERNHLLKEWIFKRSAYSMALAIIDIDKQTVAPSGGNAYRDERAAFLAGELFSIETDEDHDIRRNLFALLARKGWPLLSLRNTDLTLEEVFLRLTSGDAESYIGNKKEKGGKE